MKFKVTYQLEVGVEPRNGIDGVLLELTTEIPFAPFLGLSVIAVAGDDFRTVKDVQWDGEAFNCLFEYDDGREGRAWVRTLKKLGWKETP